MTFDAVQWYSRFFTTSPLAGAPETLLRAAEQRLQVTVPPALREVLGQTNWRNGWCVSLLGPGRLAMADDVLVFALGHQGCSWWGIHRNELNTQDPPLLFGEYADRWVDANGRLSDLLRVGSLVERLVMAPCLAEGDEVEPTGWEPIRPTLVGLGDDVLFIRGDAVMMNTETGTALAARTTEGLMAAMSELGMAPETHVIEAAEPALDELPVDDHDATPWHLPPAPRPTVLGRLFRWLVP